MGNVNVGFVCQTRPDGSLVYARTTVGCGDDFKEPEVEEYMLVGMQVQRLIGRALHPVLIQ